MTLEEFDAFRFSADSKVEYQGEIHEIASVDFEERLIRLDSKENQWVRCESCKIAA